MNQVATVAPKTFRELIQSDGYKNQIAQALPKGLDSQRMVRVILTAFNRTPKLLDCTKESLWQAVLDCSALGLFPDALGRAYLVPYKGECKLIIGYKGLIDLAYRSERIGMIQVGVVHQGDHWIYERGMHPVLKHTPCDNPGEVSHVYSIVHIKGCDMPSIDVMTKREVDAIRKRSQNSNGATSPWTTDYEEMAKKTVFRRHSKVIPMSSELASALDTDHDTIDHSLSDAATTGGRFAKDEKTIETTSETVTETKTETTGEGVRP